MDVNVDVDMDVDKHTDVTKMSLSEALCATRVFRTCLVAFVRVDGAERRPGRREHFSCLGRS